MNYCQRLFIIPISFYMTKEANLFLFPEKKEWINCLLGSMGLGVIVLGPEMQLLFANKAAYKILNIAPGEVNGTFTFYSEWDVVHEDGSFFPEKAHPVTVAMRNRKPVDNIITGISKRSGGKKTWLLVNAEPILDSEDSVTEIICSFSDITGHKLTEEKLNLLYQSLEQKAIDLAASNADLEKFVNAATHDLQEPLRIIGSFLQLLKKKYNAQLDDLAHEYIQYAVDGAGRMKKLILDLLEYSAISVNTAGFISTNPNLVLQQVTRSLSGQLSATGGTVDVTPLPLINADAVLLTRLFENLIDNAIRHCGGNKPIISISCTEDNENYIFNITDNGPGIPRGYTERIFNLFQRLHTDNEGGTGAGLAICKKIVRLHKGNIWAISEPGKGSSFCFTIPKKQETQYEKV